MVGDGVEIQVERAGIEERLARQLRMPGAEQIERTPVLEARGVFGQVALFGHHVQAAEQCQALVGDQGHDVALALDGEQLERQAGAQSVFGGDHLGARQVRRVGHGAQIQAQ